MAELVATTGNPCSLINGTVDVPASSGTPPTNPATKLLLGTTTDPAIFNDVAAQAFYNGAPNTFSSVVNRLKAGFPAAGAQAASDPNVLSSSATSSSATKVLHKFLKGDSGTSAAFLLANNSLDYTKLRNILLYDDQGGTVAGNSGSTYKSIIDDYIATKVASGAYTFNSVNVSSSPVTTTFLVSDANLWNPADENNSTPSSVLGSLLKDGFLIKKDELFKETDFSRSPTSGSESLYWLVSTSSQPTSTLTTDQLIRKNRLLSKNLRFFGAFLVEYCYYKSIYYRLLKQYYVAFNFSVATADTPLTADQWTANIDRLFSGTVAPAEKKKAKYLEGLTNQMARLNTRMNDMRRLLQTITAYYNTQFDTISRTIAGSSSTFGSNENLVQSIKALNDTTDKTKEYNDQKDFRKQIVEYTEQKNRYANMLLGLYAFLNISALAAIFHVARSS